MRWRAALALIAIFAFCILVPSVALALTNAAAHCFTETHSVAHVHQVAAKTHVHADGVSHTHHADENAPSKPADADDNTHGGNCCGLFCLTALTHEASNALVAPTAVIRTLPVLADSLSGRDPGRINRPPIT